MSKFVAEPDLAAILGLVGRDEVVVFQADIEAAGGVEWSWCRNTSLVV
jgi:hypothetical protein